MKTLKDYLHEYKETLCGKTALIKVSARNETLIVSFEFCLEHFCHLFGVTSCFISGKNPNVSEYKGFRGAENIENGTITFETLESINFKEYRRKVLNKIEAFEQLLLSLKQYYRLCNYVEFDRNKYIAFSNHSFVDNAKMKSFIGRNLNNNKPKPILLLGMEDHTGNYYPLSLLYIRDSIVGILEGQNVLRISSVDFIENDE